MPLSVPPRPLTISRMARSLRSTTATPGDGDRVDLELVAVHEVAVDHGGQQVVGGADGVDVAGEVQVEVFHGEELRVAAAGGAALDAEDRAERRLAQGQHGVDADRVHRLGETDGGDGLALAERRRGDRRDVDDLAVGLVLEPRRAGPCSRSWPCTCRRARARRRGYRPSRRSPGSAAWSRPGRSRCPTGRGSCGQASLGMSTRPPLGPLLRASHTGRGRDLRLRAQGSPACEGFYRRRFREGQRDANLGAGSRPPVCEVRRVSTLWNDAVTGRPCPAEPRQPACGDGRVSRPRTGGAPGPGPSRRPP